MTYKQETRLVLGVAIALMAGLLGFVTYRDTVIQQTADQKAPLVTPLHP